MTGLSAPTLKAGAVGNTRLLSLKSRIVFMTMFKASVVPTT